MNLVIKNNGLYRLDPECYDQKIATESDFIVILIHEILYDGEVQKYFRSLSFGELKLYSIIKDWISHEI